MTLVCGGGGFVLPSAVVGSRLLGVVGHLDNELRLLNLVSFFGQ